jgi:hypothetical protein
MPNMDQLTEALSTDPFKSDLTVFKNTKLNMIQTMILQSLELVIQQEVVYRA